MNTDDDKAGTGPPITVAETVLTTKDLKNVSELDLIALDAFLSFALGIHKADEKSPAELDEGAEHIRQHVRNHAQELLSKCIEHWKCSPQDVGIRITLTNMDKATMSMLCTFEHTKAKKQEHV